MTTVTEWKAPPFMELGKDGVLHFNFHPGQIKGHESKAREVLVLAGAQGGKTVFGNVWLLSEIEAKGEGDYIVMTATYPLLHLKLLPEFLNLFQDTLRDKDGAIGDWNKGDRVFQYRKNKTRVLFASATSPESIESATAKAAWLDEAGQKQFKRDAREAVVRRLMKNQGRILYTTTPYGLGWLKSEVYDRAGLENDIEVVNFPSWWNPTFPIAEYERQKKLLPHWKFRMFLDGVFERPVGLVYDSFDEVACKVRRFPIPASWPVYVGHDFGGANPAAIFYAQDPATGYFYAWHEYKPGPGRSTAQHVEEFKRIAGDRLVLKRAGGSHQEEEIREAYRAHGWHIQEPKIRDVATGIDRVYALHKLKKLFVFSDLQAYLDELLSYSYELNDKYEPMDVIEDKSDYHLLDAARYILSDFTPETEAHGGKIKVATYGVPKATGLWGGSSQDRDSVLVRRY